MTLRNLTHIIIRILILSLGELLVVLTFIELFTNHGSGTGVQGAWQLLFGMLEYELCCELLLLLNMAALYTEGCGVSTAECHVDVCEGRVMD